MRSVLIITPYDTIGDTILSEVIVEKLGKNFSDCKIDVLTRQGKENLFENNPYLNEVLLWGRPSLIKMTKIYAFKSATKRINNVKLILKVIRKQYDCVINLHLVVRVMRLLTILSGAKVKIGYGSYLMHSANRYRKVSADEEKKRKYKNSLLALWYTKRIWHGSTSPQGKHEVDRYLDFISDYIDTERVLPRLYPSKSDFENVKVWQQKAYVCIGPMASRFTKTFPVEKWAELIEKLHHQYMIYMLGQTDDTRTVQKICEICSTHKIIDLTGQLSFLEVGALIKGAHMNYVNDSGLLHIASAMNAPITAIFCSTVPEKGFGPLSDQSQVWEPSQKLACRPCGPPGYQACPIGTLACAYSIQIDC